MSIGVVSIHPLTNEISIHTMDEDKEKTIRSYFQEQIAKGNVKEIEIKQNNVFDVVEAIQDVISTVENKRPSIVFRRFSLSMGNNVIRRPLELSVNFTLMGDGNIGPTQIEIDRRGYESEITVDTTPNYTNLNRSEYMDNDQRRKAEHHSRKFKNRGGQKPRKGAYERYNWLRK